MSNSQTVLLSVVTAFVSGGLGGAWWQGRSQREEAWRSRLVLAADEFVTGLTQALIGLADALASATREEIEQDLAEDSQSVFDSAEVTAAVAESNRTTDEVHARLARIHLLFGPTSETARQADMAILGLRSTNQTFHDFAVPTWSDESNPVGTAIDEIHKIHGVLAAEAHKVIVRGHPDGITR